MLFQTQSLYYSTIHLGPEIQIFLTIATNFSIKIPWTPPECEAEFRVEKQDLPRLVQALQLPQPQVFKCEQRSICDDMEGLCMSLKRVAYPSYVADENTLAVLKVNMSLTLTLLNLLRVQK